ncbi:response regulator [uncultured Aquabacterium sp.]|uniref:hybrid sensor histidine kinase/response regulator n=1 Tax=uncultured Aquabacterium sp. TaxID=158753 RepID=UPI00260A9638|nr:response regulator [uncultured Aquabacterium sp.]
MSASRPEPGPDRITPLSRVLLWRVIGFSLLLSIGAALLVAHLQKNHEAAQQRALLDAVVSVHRVALSRALWELDDQAVAAQLAALHRFPVVLSAEVQGGGLSQRYAREGVAARGSVQTVREPLHAPGSDEVIGIWHLTLDEAALQGEVWTQTRRFLMLVVPLLLLMGGLVFWLVRRRVGHPVSALSHHLGTLLSGNLATPAPEPRHRPATELHRLARGITGLQQALAQELAHRDAVARELATQRDELNMVLARQTQRLDGVLSHMADGAGLLDEAGSIVLMNPAWAQMLGCGAPHEATPMPVESWLRSPSWPEVCQMLREQDRVVGCELTMSHQGGVLPVEASLSVIERGHAGAVVRVQIVLRDLSQRRQTEQALIDAREEAMAMARARSAFLTNMSHEIRTPMNAVLGMTELALRTSLSPQQRDYLQKSRQAATSLLAMLDDILDLSGIESGRLTLQHQPFLLDDVLDQVMGAVALPAQQKGLVLVLDAVFDQPQRPVGDGPRLAQVLTKLCHNAVKFTDAGEVSLTVRMTSPPGAQTSWLVAAVRDTGAGIPPEDQARVFQPFQQGDDSATRRHGGGGLGLAISRHVVERMGGTLTLRSDVDTGCDVTVQLPLSLDPVDGAGESPAAWPEGPWRSWRVLVVHAHPEAAHVLQRQLEVLGLTASVASGREAALRALSEADAADAPWDAVVLNWLMPDADVLALARDVAQLGLAQVPLRLLACAPGSEAPLLAAGGNLFDAALPQPASTTALAHELARLAERARSASAPGEAAARTPSAAPTVSSSVKGAALSGLRVLLVEDNPFNQQVAAELLMDAGARVTVAEQGQAALDHLAREPVDVVLMDIQMPVMDGLEATRRIRDNPAWADLPVLAVTAHTQASDREAALDAGMDEVLTKPLGVAMLIDALCRWRHGRRQAAPVQQAAPAPVPAAAPVAAAAPPDLPGIDRALGELHCGGRPALHQHLLDIFFKAHRDVARRLSDQIAAPDWPAAARVLHVLKADAATVGATRLADVARSLETALLGEDQAAVQLHKAELDLALDEVLRGLARRPASGAPSPAPA